MLSNRRVYIAHGVCTLCAVFIIAQHRTKIELIADEQ